MAIDTMAGANLLLQGQESSQNAFNNAYDTTTKRLDAIQTGREKATVNKLYGESLNADGTLDTNKLTQGMAQTGLGAKIPELLAQKQEQELNALKLENDNITLGQSHLAYMGQLAGGQKGKGIAGLKAVKDEYKRKGWDLSRFPPDPQTDDEANGQINTIIDSSSTELERQKQDAAIQQKRDDYELRKNTAAIAQATLENNQRHQGVVETQGATTIQQNQQKLDADIANKGRPSEVQQYSMETKYDTAEKERKLKLADIDKDLGDLEANNKETKDLLGSGVLSGKTTIGAGLFGNLVADASNAGYLPFLPDTELGKFRIALDKKIQSAKLAVMAGQKGAQTKEDAAAIQQSIEGINAVRSPKELTTLLTTIDNAEQRINKHLNSEKSIFSKETSKPNFMSGNTSSAQPAKSLSAQMAKVPAGTPEAQVEEYKQSLIEKGYK